MISQEILSPPSVFMMFAHEVRWGILQALVMSDYRVHELSAIVRRPLNVVSYHLKLLREQEFIREHRSAADARDVYYHLDLAQLQTVLLAGEAALHPALASSLPLDAPVSHPPMRILFLCTHNSARSQMAEGIARALGRGAITALSAGSEPGIVHPDAVHVLAETDIDIQHQTSKHLEQFRDDSFDYIITVCDRVQESCPIFPNDPERIHWSFPDPSAIADPDERLAQFRTIARELTTRIRYLQRFFAKKQGQK